MDVGEVIWRSTPEGGYVDASLVASPPCAHMGYLYSVLSLNYSIYNTHGTTVIRSLMGMVYRVAVASKDSFSA